MALKLQFLLLKLFYHQEVLLSLLSKAFLMVRPDWLQFRTRVHAGILLLATVPLPLAHMSVEPSTTSNPSAAGDASNAEAEAFRSGALAGWNRAWAEYYTASFADAQPRQPVLDTSEEAAPAFELSDEWAAFFARGAARRKKAREQEAEDARAEEADDREREEEAVPLFLGGARDAASRTRAERLYGKRAEEVLLAEARIDARFQAEIASHRAAVWPALPLTAWQPRKESTKRLRNE